MNLTVNGKTHELAGGSGIPALLAELGANPEHSAVTVNGDLVASRHWNHFKLSEGNTVEVLTFVGGG